MSENINLNTNRLAASVTGEKTLDVNAAKIDHDILIECATPGVIFTITRRKQAGSVYAPFSENTINSNESGTFRLPASNSIKVTPSDPSAVYTVIWDSF